MNDKQATIIEPTGRVLTIEPEDHGTRITDITLERDIWTRAPFSQVLDGINRWLEGALIQNALPFFTPTEREFLLTGMTDEEWDEAFPPGDEDE